MTDEIDDGRPLFWRTGAAKLVIGGAAAADDACKYCGGKIAVRNPRGDCDHLCWPDNLTEEAKRANGYRKVERIVTTWEK